VTTARGRFPVTLREARDDDAERLLRWRNDPDAVRFSGTGRPVTTSEHATWLAAARDDPGVHIWIAEADGTALGQVRLDVRDRVGVVSIGVAAEHRGAGNGSAMLQTLVSLAAGDSALRSLKALVDPDNIASLRIFEGAGFRRLPETEEGLVVLVRSPSA
jgi:RimJ/RimL family protein N-acetyltransferase